MPDTTKPKKKGYSPLRGRHPVYSLVGEIASEFSRIEHMLDVTIWRMAGLSAQIGSSITAQLMGIRPRCLSILALANNIGLPEEIRKEVRQFMNDSFKPSEERNRLVHDSWYIHKKSGETAQLRSMPKEQLLYGHAPVSEADCQKVLKLIHGFAKRTDTLKGHVLAALAATQSSEDTQL